ncbi:MAG: NAD(+)/NADH kinase [Lachnospiraceae bacterium]|nr:NAD(+)/NADH kinase [Lachnospiraceae bacterium]
MNKLYIIVNMDKDPKLAVTDRIIEYLDRKGIDYFIKKTYPYSEDVNLRSVTKDEIPKDTDFIIILGGDGSFLHSAVALAELNIPVAGLNLGTLGYLSQFNTDRFEQEFDEMLSGAYFIEERIMIAGELVREGRIIKQDISLNDVVVRRCDGLSAIKLNISLNGSKMRSSMSDGLIVATPTGSTAYNLSVGGAVIEPGARVMAITPIAPHSLSERSVIVADDSDIEIELASIPRNEAADILIGFDSKFMTQMKPGDVLKLRKADNSIKLIRLNEYNFFDVLHSKMNAD